MLFSYMHECCLKIVPKMIPLSVEMISFVALSCDVGPFAEAINYLLYSVQGATMY